MLSIVATRRSDERRSGARLRRACQAPLNSSIPAMSFRVSGVISRFSAWNATPKSTPNYTHLLPPRSTPDHADSRAWQTIRSGRHAFCPFGNQECPSSQAAKSPDSGCYKLSSMSEADFWRECPLISSDPEVVHGAPVFKWNPPARPDDFRQRRRLPRRGPVSGRSHCGDAGQFPYRAKRRRWHPCTP